MKQKDFLLIGIIVFFGALLAFGITKLFISSEKNIQTVEVVKPISDKFDLPDKRYFNEKSFDPTQIIKIKDNNNQTPFTGDRPQ